MENRSVIMVIVLSVVTFGLYTLYWFVKTKGEMVKRGADIPTSWLLIIPIANIWWMWKYAEGAEKVTNGKMSGILAFILLFLLGIIGVAILQNEFNKVAVNPPTVGQESTPRPETVAAEHAADSQNEHPPTQPPANPPMVQ